MIPNSYTLECTNCGYRDKWITNYVDEVYNLTCPNCKEQLQVLCKYEQE